MLTWSTKLMAHLVLLAVSSIVLIPVLLVAWVSLGAPDLSERVLTWMHWKNVLGYPVLDSNGELTGSGFPALLWLWNSIKVAFIYACLSTLCASAAAYGLVRRPFPGQSLISKSLLVIQLFPSTLAMVAVYVLLRKLGGYFPNLGIDSHGGLILAYMGSLAFFIWMIKGQLKNLSPSLEESARVEGAGNWHLFRYLLLPLIAPGLLVAFLMAFTMAYSEVPLATILLQDTNSLTVPVAANLYLDPQQFRWGEFAAFSLLSGLPVCVLLLLLQNWIVRKKNKLL